MTKKILLCFIIVLLPISAMAAEIRSEKQLTIANKLKNAYLLGQKINVESDQESDLTALGSDISIGKNVQKNLLVAGGDVNVEGNVGDSAKIFAGQLKQSGEIGEDMIAFFGTGVISNSKVKGDLIIFGGDTTLDTTIDGKTRVYGGSVKMKGSYQGDVDVTADNFEIGDDTVVKGKLVFTGENRAKISSTAKLEQGITFNQSAKKPVGFAKFASVNGILGLIETLLSLVVVTLILSSLLKNYSSSVVGSWEKNKLAAGLYGLLTIAVVPIAIFIALFSVIGGIIGTIMIFTYITALILSYCYGAIFIGKLFLKLIGRDEDKSSLLSCIAGSVLTVIISLIPFVGQFVVFIFFLMALGSISLVLVKTIKKSMEKDDGQASK